ncbi:MAG: pyridoxamine 5'-phosphate oxidase family protein [Chloroflexi bacterium]|nr:pyridoxamine 5'-phosphate oxidase family protein [Chloroflexota bacterium]
MQLTEVGARRRATLADHGVLSTLRADGRIDAVPACFALDGDLLAIPIDRAKPKASASLQRARNLEAHAEATFLCERWDATDWSRLWWVRLRVRRIEADEPSRTRLEGLLRSRYPQYRTTPFDQLLVFRVEEVSGWSAT